MLRPSGRIARRLSGASLLLALLLFVMAGPSRAAEVAWLADVDVAWRTAVEQQRPILLFVTRSGCRYCVEMKQKTFRDPAVAAGIRQGFVPVAADAAAIAPLVKQLGITAYPTTLIISPQATVVDRMQGYLPPDRFLSRLEQAAPHIAARAQKKTS